MKTRKLKLKLPTEVGYQNTKATEITAAITTLPAATSALHMPQQQQNAQQNWLPTVSQTASQSANAQFRHKRRKKNIYIYIKKLN